jgi:hypothetical protein
VTIGTPGLPEAAGAPVCASGEATSRWAGVSGAPETDVKGKRQTGVARVPGRGHARAGAGPFDQLRAERQGRKFLGAPVGAVTAWSLAAYGQQAVTPVTGFLPSASLTDPPQLGTALRQGLKNTG